METLNTNILGNVWLSRSAIAHMKKNGAGDLVFIGSTSGFRGGRNEAVYAATKHAQLGFAGAIDREVRELGIRVSSILPGGVRTEFGQSNENTSRDNFDTFLDPVDVARALNFIVSQPLTMRITQLVILPMSQGS
jgi:3-oxoacyl-[acyl-carrier protein] reductase